MRRFFNNFGIEDWIFGLSGLSAITFSIMSFLGFLPPLEQTLQIIVGAIGVLMLALVTQNTRRHADIEQLRRAIGISDIRLVNRGEEFGQQIALSLIKTRYAVSDTYLTSAVPHRSSNYGFAGSQAEYHKRLFDRTIKGEITFRNVTAIFHKQWLEDVLFKLLLHEGGKYFIRHYEPSNHPTPVLNIMVFDEASYYLGGFHIKDSAGDDHTLFINDPTVAKFLSGYWRVVWENAIPLNEGGIINWDELRRVGKRLGIEDAEFTSLVDKTKELVKEQKRQLARR